MVEDDMESGRCKPLTASFLHATLATWRDPLTISHHLANQPGSLGPKADR